LIEKKVVFLPSPERSLLSAMELFNRCPANTVQKKRFHFK